MKQCSNFSKKFSNRRAIRLERRSFDYQKNKQEMKRSLVLQRGQSASYHADKKRYEQSVSFPIPRFENMAITGDTLGFAEETHTMSMLPALVVTASVSQLPAYITHDTCVRTTKRLVAPPQTPEEHYIATGGIIPYRKHVEDESPLELR